MPRPNYIRVLAILTAMLAAAFLAGLMASGLASAQTGTTFTVNSTSDPGTGFCDLTECTLREAITAANTNLDADTINVSATGTINLQSRLPGLTSNMEIKGPGADNLTVRRDAGGDYLIFKIFDSNVSISGLTVTNGKEAFDAGGISIIDNSHSHLVTLSGITVSGNSASFTGGGIDSSASTLNLTKSTVSGNSSGSFGGGIMNRIGNTLNITNSTLSGNSTTSGSGGGIYTDGGTTLNLTNSTLSGNSASTGANLASNSSVTGSATFKSTIVANPQGGGDNCAGVPVTTQGKNLEYPGTSCGFSGSGDIQNLDPLLGPLANNGGPTQTMALLKGSPALNVIPKATNGCGTTITTDQRGLKRPQGKRCDIGAYEKKVRHRR